jgi:hypothetical protein
LRPSAGYHTKVCFFLKAFKRCKKHFVFEHISVAGTTHFLFQKACHDIFIVRKNQFRKS